MDILHRLDELSQQAKALEPDATQRSSWLQAAEQYAESFLESMTDPNSLTFWDVPTRGDKPFQWEVSDTPTPIEITLAHLKNEVDTVGLNPASSGHLGYIPGGGIYTGALGDFLAAVANRYAGLYFGSPGAVRLENALIRWMCSIMGFPTSSAGNLTSGGSIANLVAITTARDAKGITSKVVERAVIYLTLHIHHCVQKAIRIAGLAEAQIRYVPMDGNFRMDAVAAEKIILEDIQNGYKPFLLVASAGTTDMGAIDPLTTLGDICKRYNLWYHIDAAYGGFFILTEEGNASLQGIKYADSLVIDPHKGLFLSYGLGAVLIKDAKAMIQSHYYRANYLQDVDLVHGELSPADVSPELTKHFRGLRMWLSLQLFGLRPFKAALSEKIWLCRYFYSHIQQHGFEVGNFPDLSVMVFRYVPLTGDANIFNEQLIAFVWQDGRVFLSSTSINGVYWIRLAVLSFRTHLSTINTCIEVLQNGVKHLEKTND
ncbi:MAG: aminotransferase class I/II-fold pyridoxal phosphate-dependent enzyme [Saprospiraceae bacterium]|nr:aminotransferase class I/II-fold pyridoxal phosphate-dependent enzyme [Saprospiraceae bacterium]MBP7699205.1 aminotransferase class I/II-fold pyridoxal phosphate-dependent enzyme [Saprospiraceae bacterium]